MKEIFAYNNDCNLRLLDLLMEHQNNVPEKSISLINHLINSHEIWNARILQTSHVGVWDIRPLKQLPNFHRNNHFNSMEIINKIDFQQEITYTNSKGESFCNTVKDILYHIIHHSTYHRAQIATDLKQNGISPINTDYIFYKRRQKKKAEAFSLFFPHKDIDRNTTIIEMLTESIL